MGHQQTDRLQSSIPPGLVSEQNSVNSVSSVPPLMSGNSAIVNQVNNIGSGLPQHYNHNNDHHSTSANNGGGPISMAPPLHNAPVTGDNGNNSGSKAEYKYRDFGHVAEDDAEEQQGYGDGQQQNGNNRGGNNESSIRVQKFPVKLYAILAQKEFHDIICWMPHGRSWKVLKPSMFENLVMPLFFEYSNYHSFNRLVNAWSFRRISSGPDRGSYYHELFLRGKPHLQKYMRRLPKTHKKLPMKKQDEPDFYTLDKTNILPQIHDAPIPGAAATVQAMRASQQHGSGVPGGGNTGHAHGSGNNNSVSHLSGNTSGSMSSSMVTPSSGPNNSSVNDSASASMQHINNNMLSGGNNTSSNGMMNYGGTYSPLQSSSCNNNSGMGMQGVGMINHSSPNMNDGLGMHGGNSMMMHGGGSSMGMNNGGGMNGMHALNGGGMHSLNGGMHGLSGGMHGLSGGGMGAGMGGMNGSGGGMSGPGGGMGGMNGSGMSMMNGGGMGMNGGGNMIGMGMNSSSLRNSLGGGRFFDDNALAAGGHNDIFDDVNGMTMMSSGNGGNFSHANNKEGHSPHMGMNSGGYNSNNNNNFSLQGGGSNHMRRPMSMRSSAEVGNGGDYGNACGSHPTMMPDMYNNSSNSNDNPNTSSGNNGVNNTDGNNDTLDLSSSHGRGILNHRDHNSGNNNVPVST